MLEVKIPTDIQQYKSKLIAGLSTRQFLSIAVALAVDVPIGVFGKDRISGEILPWIIILIAAPILAWGFLRFEDMPFEEFAKLWFSKNFLPQVRPYEDTEENLFYELHKEILDKAIQKDKENEEDRSDTF